MDKFPTAVSSSSEVISESYNSSNPPFSRGRISVILLKQESPSSIMRNLDYYGKRQCMLNLYEPNWSVSASGTKGFKIQIRDRMMCERT